jgi:F0F1-type ATP synthase assembly protein I
MISCELHNGLGGSRDIVEQTPENQRSSVAMAAHWATRVMTIALEMVLPGVLGIWLDRRLGTAFVFTLLGFGLGMTVGLWHVIRIGAANPRQPKPDRRNGLGNG